MTGKGAKSGGERYIQHTDICNIGERVTYVAYVNTSFQNVVCSFYKIL